MNVLDVGWKTAAGMPCTRVDDKVNADVCADDGMESNMHT